MMRRGIVTENLRTGTHTRMPKKVSHRSSAPKLHQTLVGKLPASPLLGRGLWPPRKMAEGLAVFGGAAQVVRRQVAGDPAYWPDRPASN